jgi:hypothetical protein
MAGINGNQEFMLRRSLIFAFMFVLSSSYAAFATPIESLPDPQILAASQIGPGIPQIGPTIKIPDSVVHIFLREGPDSRFELFFIDLRYGWDLEDFEFYKAWCLNKDKPIRRNALHKVRLYSCYSPDLPRELRSVAWDRVNYIINHRPKTASKESVQQAIWYFTNGKKQAKPTPEAAQLIEEANDKGKDYIPGDDELMAVVCVPKGEMQSVFVESKVPQAVTFDVADATFVQPTPPTGGGTSSLAFPLVAGSLFALSAVTSNLSSSTTPPPDAPPIDHKVFEPDSLILLTIGVSAILMARRRAPSKK